MKILGYNITKATTPDTKLPPTLVVTGSCSDAELKNFEDHCQKKGQCVIATKLPVLGVFNMQNPTVTQRVEGT